MKRTLLIFFIFSFSFTFAQKHVPGYFGKRFSIGYSAMFFPALRDAPSGKALGRKLNAINFTQSIELNYVLNSRRALCFSVGNYRSNLRYYASNPISGSYFIKASDKLSTLLISCGFKTFRKKMIAPLGPYMKWEALYGKSIVRYDEIAHKSGFGSDYQPPDNRMISFNAFGAGWGMGFQRIISDKFVVDLGFRTAVLIDLASFNGVASEVHVFASDRVFKSQFMNVRIGIGFLAF
ncbi:MAG: hypothetical protein M3R27_09690 [Bacteroidota bacterium]|nr:hypothetical protein [Bacteroidota bacterium]